MVGDDDFRSRALLAALCTSLLALACSGGDPSSAEPETEGARGALYDDPSWPELEGSGGPHGEVVMTNALGEARRYVYEVVDGLAIAEGDMILGTVDELENAPKGAVRTDRLWPSRTLVYTLNDNLTATQKTRISDAMAHWTSTTGVAFRTRVNNEAAYVEFQKVDSGCKSSVGRSGNKQTLILSTSCSRGNIIHEIGHALGFEHEHTRADRNDTIKYYPERVLEGKSGNFTISNQSYHDDLFSMDFGSIMMYGSYSFAKGEDGLGCGKDDPGCEPPMTRLNGATWDSQRTSLSDTDIKTFRKLYDTFTRPRVNNLPIIAAVANRNQFCKEQGYASSSSNDFGPVTGSVSGYVNGQWITITDTTPPIENFTAYGSIRCVL